MNANIENPATCEVRSVIRFLNAKNVRPAEIHRQIVEVYGEGVMNEGNVRKWCRLFIEGRTNVHDEERSGRPSLVTDDLRKDVNATIEEHRRFTISELHEQFPVVSRSLIQEIVTEHIHYKKLHQMGAKNVEGCPQGETRGGSVDVSGALPQRWR
jgi:transposase